VSVGEGFPLAWMLFHRCRRHLLKTNDCSWKSLWAARCGRLIVVSGYYLEIVLGVAIAVADKLPGAAAKRAVQALQVCSKGGLWGRHRA